MSAPTFEVARDPVTKRYRAKCPSCGYSVVRAKREAAAHVMSQHVTYEHGGSRS